MLSEKENIKHTAKDSVFTDLFGKSKYSFQLYQALHPEDNISTEEDITNVTIENALTDDLYNDLGFMLGNRLLILVEAQSTWSVNIIIRALEYLVETYRRYFNENGMDLYKSKKVKIPKPELYVLYIGSRKERPEEISLSQEFFGGEETAVEVKVKMIYDGQKGDIINQYVTFTRVLDEQIQIHGRTKKAVQEVIRICKDKNVLKEYLENRESEVVDIMMQLYDQEEIMRVHILGKEKDAAIRTAVDVYRECGMSFMDVVEKIAIRFKMTQADAEEEVQEYWKE